MWRAVAKSIIVSTRDTLLTKTAVRWRGGFVSFLCESWSWGVYRKWQGWAVMSVVVLRETVHLLYLFKSLQALQHSKPSRKGQRERMASSPYRTNWCFNKKTSKKTTVNRKGKVLPTKNVSLAFSYSRLPAKVDWIHIPSLFTALWKGRCRNNYAHVHLVLMLFPITLGPVESAYFLKRTEEDSASNRINRIESSK